MPIRWLAGMDLLYGFVMAAVFLTLYRSLPGETGPAKGVSFGFLAWFFRVFMQVVSNRVMLKVPPAALVYTLITGLAEVTALGVFYGWTLKPGA